MNFWTKIMVCSVVLILKSNGKRLKINNHLRIATYNNPLAGIKNVLSGNTGFMERDLLAWLSTDLNFTYDIVVPKDVYQLGILKQNGSWTGGLGLLKREEADMTIGFGSRNLARFRAFDMTSAIITDNIGIMIPYPVVGINSSAFADIFDSLTWLMIVVSTFVMISSVWYIGRRLKPQDQIDYEDLSLYVLGVILGQGGWIPSHSVGFKVIFGSWVLSLVVIVYGYQGTLISRLSAPYIHFLAKSLEEVASDEQISPFTLKESTTHSEFKDSLLPSFKAINSRFETNPDLLLTSTKNAVETILNTAGSSDLILNDEIKRDYEKTGGCRAHMLKNKVMVRRNGLFLQKYSKWTRAIDHHILLLRQHGLGQYLEEKYKTYTKSKCTVDEQVVRQRDYNGPLKMYQVKGVFYILCIGLSLSCLILTVEFLLSR